jgi:monothiol glutaredoxin
MSEVNQEVQDKIKEVVESEPVLLFMKGTPDAPQCGFSAEVVAILKKHDVNFAAINVLEDWDIREGVKTFSNWNTIPQLYIKGEFIGGCDITRELDRKGELQSILAKLG